MNPEDSMPNPENAMLNLENVMLNKVSQAQKDKAYYYPICVISRIVKFTESKILARA